MKRQNIKNIKELLGALTGRHYAVMGVIAGMCLLMFTVALFSAPTSDVEIEDEFTNLPPANFIPKPPAAPPVKEAEKPDFNVEDVFANVDTRPSEDVLELRRKQKQFELERSSSKGFQRISIDYSGEGTEPDYSISNITQFQNMDKDYSRQGEPKTIPSYPVNLSRVLPITETVPVILLDEIKSELSGEVVRAKISQDVYGYHKRKILIPAGSTAIGRYEPLKKVGDSRLDIEFYRVLTPEGINIQLTGFAADSEGSQGLTGHIDNKNWEKFGVAGIAASIQAATQLSVDVNDNQQEAVADAIAEPIDEVITQVISESINIAPTVRIQKGTMFFIKFQADIFFPPARDKQVLTQKVNEAAPFNQSRR